METLSISVAHEEEDTWYADTDDRNGDLGKDPVERRRNVVYIGCEACFEIGVSQVRKKDLHVGSF